MKRYLLVLFVSILCLFPAYRPVDAGVNEDLLKATEEGKIEEVKRLLGAGADIDARNPNKETPLILAIRVGKTDVAKLLLDKGADVNARNKWGDTALWRAANANSIEVAGILVGKGADLNVEGNGVTPALIAAIRGHREMVDFLVSRGADVRAGNSKSELTPLHRAAIRGDEGGAASLIANGAEVDRDAKIWANGETPLFFAILLGRRNIVELLATKGASLDNPSFWGFPVYVAAERGRTEIADLLVSRGADLNRADAGGETGLEKALKNKNDPVAGYFIAKGANVRIKPKGGGTFLGLAIQGGCARAARMIVEKGADVNGRDDSGNTPLGRSIGGKQPEIARLLIERGADVNAKDGSGDTPLKDAIVTGQPEIARLLIERGADVNGSDGSGKTPLGMAISRKQPGIARLLIERGADANEKEKTFGATLLHLAAENGWEEEAGVLLEKGLDPLAKDSLDRTPASLAVERGHVAVARMFLEKGLNPDAKNKYGETLLHLAVVKRNAAMVSLLVEKGADVNATTGSGKTPAYLAEASGFADMADILRRHGAASKREELSRLAKALAGKCNSLSLFRDDIKVAVRIARSLSPPPAIPEEARRSFAEGLAAFDLARSPSDYEEPKRKFENAACLAPWWPDVYFNLSLIDEKLRKYHDAVANLEIYLLAAQDSRDADAARQKIHKINYLQERRSKAEEHINRGADLFNGKDYKGAVEENKEAIRLDPDHALAHTNLGGAYVKLDRTQEGIVELKEGIRLGEDSAYGYSTLAFAYKKLGDVAKAIDLLEGYSKKRPFASGIGEIHLRLVRYYEESGQAGKAVAYLEEVKRFGMYDTDGEKKAADEALARLKSRIRR